MVRRWRCWRQTTCSACISAGPSSPRRRPWPSARRWRRCGRRRGCLGPCRARQRLFFDAPARGRTVRIRTGAAAQSEFLAGAGLLRAGAVLWRTLAGLLCGRATRHPPQPARSVLAIYYGIAAYARFVGKNYDEAIALAREAIRQRGDLTGAYRVLTVSAGMSGKSKSRRTALAELRRTQPNISLAWIATQLPWSSRPTASTIWKGSAAPDWNRRWPHAAVQRGWFLTGTGCSVANP